MNKKNPFKHRDEIRKYNANKAQRAKKLPPKVESNIQSKPENLTDNADDSIKQECESETASEPNTEIEVFPNRVDTCEAPVFGVPKSSVQFLSDWRLLKGKDEQRSAYIKVSL